MNPTIKEYLKLEKFIITKDKIPKEKLLSIFILLGHLILSSNSKNRKVLKKGLKDLERLC